MWRSPRAPRKEALVMPLPPRSPVLALALALVALLVACTPRGGEMVVCPSLPHNPHAALMLSHGLGTGTYDVSLEIAGATEHCAITVGPLGPGDEVSVPGMVQGPTTAVDTTCTGLGAGTMGMDGRLASVDVRGTPASFTVTIRQGDRTLGTLTASPDYTPDACGMVQPLLTLEVAPSP